MKLHTQVVTGRRRDGDVMVKGGPETLSPDIIAKKVLAWPTNIEACTVL